jgi:hypothetical protein
VPVKNAKQEFIDNITVHVAGTAAVRLVFLPFLGEIQKVQGKSTRGGTVFVIPRMNKGGVAWLEP